VRFTPLSPTCTSLYPCPYGLVFTGRLALTFEGHRTRKLRRQRLWHPPCCARYQTLRVAVYDMVKNQLGPESCMPEALKFIVRNLFPSMYDGFVITCDTCIGRGFDGTALHDPFSRPQHDTMQYCKLKELIVELKLQCDRDDEEQDALDEQAQGATARSATSGAEEAGLAAASQSPAPVEPHSPSSSLFTNVPAAAGAEESGASNSNTG